MCAVAVAPLFLLVYFRLAGRENVQISSNNNDN